MNFYRYRIQKQYFRPYKEGQEEGQQDGQYKCQEEGQGIANMRAINLLLAGAIYTVL